MSSEPKPTSGDLLGLAPYGEAIKVVAQGTVDGAGAFLGRICLPAAEEFGLLLRDKVSGWRRENAVAITTTAQRLLEQQPNGSNLHAHPRLVMGILEHGSWADTPALQEMWGGLLASSCTESGNDHSNLMFVSLLSQLTPGQAKLLAHMCSVAIVRKSPVGWLYTAPMTVPREAFADIVGTSDVHVIDRELDHLRSLGLLSDESGLAHDWQGAQLQMATLALQLYARTQGSADPEEFYGDRVTVEPIPPRKKIDDLGNAG